MPLAPPQITMYWSTKRKTTRFYVSVHKTTSQQFVVIYLASATTSEVLLLNPELPDAEPVFFCHDARIMNIASIIISTRFYLRSNRDGKKTSGFTAPCSATKTSGRR